MRFRDANPNYSILETAGLICEALPGWTVGRRAEETISSPVWASIRRADGAEVHLCLDDYKGRIEFSGTFPQGFQDRDSVSISVSALRPVAKIAAEIERRLLTIYLPQFAEAVERKRAAEAGRAESIDTAAAVARVLGEPFSKDNARRAWGTQAGRQLIRFAIDHEHYEKGYGEFEVDESGGGTFTFHFKGQAQALALAGAVNILKG
jgi:hypothetical protein